MNERSDEQRAKRLLSPESAELTSAEKLDKRQRHDSLLIVDDLPRNSKKMAENKEPEPDFREWMSRISEQIKLAADKTDLEKLASKSDFHTMNDRIDAQGEEIKQLRDEINQVRKDFDGLRLALDRSEAEKLNRTYETNSGYGSLLYINNMAPIERGRAMRQDTTRRNLVIEGLKGDDETEMITNLLQLMSTIGSIVYRSDIESIKRLERRDTTNKAPGPVIVTFNRISVRDGILKKKIYLRRIEGMNEVYINADNTVEVRRTRAFFRRVARSAREDGEIVELRHSHIKIGEAIYTLDELQQIPKKYMPENNSGDERRACAMTTDAETETSEMNPRRERYATAKRRITTSSTPMMTNLIRPNEKMRITEAGLCFSGPTAYPSNLHYAPVSYQKKKYICNEQAYQCTKATHHDQPDLAVALKALTNSHEIKSDANDIVVTDEWNRKAPGILWDLLDEKMKENPELLERLIETGPLRLIEASSSMRWGGVGPL